MKSSLKMLKVVLFLALTPQTVLADCTTPWLQLNSNTCVAFNDLMVYWHSAADTCSEAGGWMVHDDNTEKHALIVHLMKQQGITSTWIGGRKAEKKKKRNWVWMPGSKRIQAAFWGPKEPSSRNEHCIAIEGTLDYKWNSANCYDKHRFICEKKS